MARKRTIDPAIWTDEAFVSVGISERLMYIGLISNADDDGRISGSPVELALKIFPNDRLSCVKTLEWRDSLHRSGLIYVYVSNGKTYIQLNGWPRHQKLQWYTPSTLPTPTTSPVTPPSVPEVLNITPRIPQVLETAPILSLLSHHIQPPSLPGLPGAREVKVNTYPEVTTHMHALFCEATGRDPARFKLSDKKAARYAELVAWAGSEEDAIRGIRKVGNSVHHRGQNATGKRYDDLDDKPFRTADAFRGWCEEPLLPSPQTGSALFPEDVSTRNRRIIAETLAAAAAVKAANGDDHHEST